MASPLRDARTGRPDDLEELVQSVRHALERLGERLPPGWTTEAVEDLRAGRLTGWYRPNGPEGGAIGFLSRRTGRAFGHVHVEPGPDPVGRASELAERLAGGPGPEGRPLTVGTSGLAPQEEAEVAGRWAAEPGRRALRRYGLQRPLDAAGALEQPPLPSGYTSVGARDVREAALADLDLRGFGGSPDAELFAGDTEEYLRMVHGILDGRLGRFLDEASFGLVAPDGTLAGFLLTVELSPRTGLFADLVVAPTQRRLGLGRHLLVRGLRALRALGFETAQLWVTDGNEPARRLYEAVGLVPFASTWLLVQGAGAGPQPQRAR